MKPFNAVNFPRACGEGGVGREILPGCTQPSVHSSNWKHSVLGTRFASDAAPAALEYVGFEQVPVFARAVALVR